MTEKPRMSKKNNPADTVEQWPIEKLVPYAKNSRTHSENQIAQLAASIKEWGFTSAILVDEDGGIIAGHGRVMAARKLGLASLPVMVAKGWSEAQKRAYVIADNKLALNAGWDNELLALELAELDGLGFDVELTGFSGDEIKALMPVEVTEGLTDPDDAPAVQENPVTVPGDVWVMGKHRLMCGDSASVDAVEKLLNGALADLVVTDPPYGVSYADKNRSLNASGRGNRIQTPIKNDHLQGDDLKDFFLAAFSSMFVAMKPGAPFYVFAPQGGEQMMMMMMMQEARLPVRHELIWVKNNHVLGRADYHYKHEPVLYGWKDGAGHPWYGDRNKFSIWHVDKPMQSKLHPTMKPVELVEISIQNSSKGQDVVLDLFGGSGSTLIACEKTSRQARLMELDPRYCDVIVKRYIEFTGKNAILESSGKTFDEVSREKSL
jgi:DNA modification methylase